MPAVPDEPEVPVVKTEKDWLRIAQFIAVALIPMLQSVQLSTKGGDPSIPPAPPAPVITAATLHEDILRVEKRLDDLAAKSKADVADLYTEFRSELARIEKRIDEQAKKK